VEDIADAVAAGADGAMGAATDATAYPNRAWQGRWGKLQLLSSPPLRIRRNLAEPSTPDPLPVTSQCCFLGNRFRNTAAWLRSPRLTGGASRKSRLKSQFLLPGTRRRVLLFQTTNPSLLVRTRLVRTRRLRTRLVRSPPRQVKLGTSGATQHVLKKITRQLRPQLQHRWSGSANFDARLLRFRSAATRHR
jgi:hypothetical protein